MQLAFRVILETKTDRDMLKPANPDEHYIVPGDRFMHKGVEWECEAVIVKYLDGVPYPAQDTRLVIAGDRASKGSIMVDSRECVRVDDEPEPEIEWRHKYEVVQEHPTTGETVKYFVSLTDREVEKLRRIHHGYISITRLDNLEDLNGIDWRIRHV